MTVPSREGIGSRVNGASVRNSAGDVLATAVEPALSPYLRDQILREAKPLRG
jgi:hypothetical protein